MHEVALRSSNVGNGLVDIELRGMGQALVGGVGRRCGITIQYGFNRRACNLLWKSKRALRQRWHCISASGSAKVLRLKVDCLLWDRLGVLHSAFTADPKCPPEFVDPIFGPPLFLILRWDYILPNTNTIPTGAALWQTIMFGIQHLVVNLIDATLASLERWAAARGLPRRYSGANFFATNRLQRSENLLEVPAALNGDQAFDVLQDEDLRSFEIYVVKDVVKDSASPFVVIEALLFPCNTKRLARKTCNIQIHLWTTRIISSPNVRVELKWRKVGFNGFSDVRAVVACKGVLIWNVQVAHGLYRSLHS